ncbi:MAG TPA: pirin family protein [Bacteroidales bacterium]|nr:pirin family protein [Bacteroidales bacterium]HPJ04449.1 pirin family protein [Bacteroidales bacterium]HPQ63015.1 pirin family protein [Bacteroidales bacterium]
MSRRKFTQAVRGQHAVDGAGVHLRRVLGYRTIRDFDPFLMLDGFDSANPEDYIKGFPWHPHRGIETVTYLLSGDIEHGDSLGNSGVIGDLQCQWMTAGSGIIHQEMPRASERMLGCQLWVNLPKKDKMTQPAYRDIRQQDVAVVSEENATVRVLSGNYKNSKGAVKGEYVKVQYLDVALDPDSIWSYAETSNDQTMFLYLIDGTLAADEALENFEEKACAMLMTASSSDSSDFDEVRVKAGHNGARFFLIAARPLQEPVAWGGPIVMNTQEELNLAFSELESKTFIKHDNPLEL